MEVEIKRNSPKQKCGLAFRDWLTKAQYAFCRSSQIDITARSCVGHFKILFGSSGPGSWEGWQPVGVFHAGNISYTNLSCWCIEAFCRWAGLRNDPWHHGNLSLKVSAQKCTKVPTPFSGSILILSHSHIQVPPQLIPKNYFGSSWAWAMLSVWKVVQPIMNTIQNGREPTKDLQSKELTTAISSLFSTLLSAIPNQLETTCHFSLTAHPKRKSRPF